MYAELEEDSVEEEFEVLLDSVMMVITAMRSTVSKMTDTMTAKMVYFLLRLIADPSISILVSVSSSGSLLGWVLVASWVVAMI